MVLPSAQLFQSALQSKSHLQRPKSWEECHQISADCRDSGFQLHISRVMLRNGTLEYFIHGFVLEIVLQMLMGCMPLLELISILLFVVVICGERP